MKKSSNYTEVDSRKHYHTYDVKSMNMNTRLKPQKMPMIAHVIMLGLIVLLFTHTVVKTVNCNPTAQQVR